MPLEKTRTVESRENNTREQEWTYEEPDALDIPDIVLERFNAEDMVLRWVRINTRGKDDYINVGKKLNEGWVFVTPSEVPEMSTTSIVLEEGRYAGVVSRGDLALAKIQKGRHDARTKHFQKKSADLMHAIDVQLDKASDSKMPISNNSKSQIIKGRKPSFSN